MIIRFETFREREQALAAVGLALRRFTSEALSSYSDSPAASRASTRSR